MYMHNSFNQRNHIQFICRKTRGASCDLSTDIDTNLDGFHTMVIV